MKRILTREIMPERSCSGLTCVLLGLFPLAVGSLMIAFGRWSWGAFSFLGFGALCVLGGIAVWRGVRWGMLLASLLHVVVALFGVVVGWDGPISLLAGVFPMCGAAYFYMCYRDTAAKP